MEYRNVLRKYKSGKLQSVFLHIKNIYKKSTNKDILLRMSISLCYFFLYTCIHASTLNRTSLIYCVSGVTLSNTCKVFVRIKISRYDVCVSSLNWKKLEVKRCGYFTSLTKFGFLTHLENLLKTTKLAVYFIILLETFLNTSLFTNKNNLCSD